MPTINDLRQQAATIKNATQVGENTATRVGTTFETIADLLEGMGGVTNLSTIDIGSIDTLNTTGDMLVGTPNIYTLTKTIGANTFKVGTLFQFANNGRYDVAQVIVSQFIVDADGRIDTTSADQEVHIFYRLCKTMNGGSLPTPIGTWTTWTELGGSGGSGVTVDPYPTQNSGNAVSSGGVFERLQDVAPKVDISAIDDIDEYSDMLAGVSPFYVVTKTLSGNVFRIGTLMEFANQGRYILYQILATDYVLNDDGTLDTTLSENGGLKLIWRMKQFSGNPPAGVTIDVWSAWSYLSGGGAQPDNEDIDLNASDQLQFANKAYDASAFSGLGRVYLRKNIVTSGGVEKNVLTQAMVNTANTIYHIQYDYDLNGQTITLPAGCVLEFNGGSLANGFLNLNNAELRGDVNITAEPAWDETNEFWENYKPSNLVLNVSWFGAKADGVSDDAPAIKRCIKWLHKNGATMVFDLKGTYILGDGVKDLANDPNMTLHTGYSYDPTSAVLTGDWTGISDRGAYIAAHPANIGRDISLRFFRFTNLTIEGNGVTIKSHDGNGYCKHNELFRFNGCDYLKVKDITIDANRENRTDTWDCLGDYSFGSEVASYAMLQNDSLYDVLQLSNTWGGGVGTRDVSTGYRQVENFALSYCNYAIIENVISTGSLMDGMNFNGFTNYLPHDLNVRNSTFEHSSRHNFTTGGASVSLLENCCFQFAGLKKDETTSLYGSTCSNIDFEGEYGIIENIVVRGCVFRKTAKNTFVITVNTRYCVIDGCRFESAGVNPRYNVGAFKNEIKNCTFINCSCPFYQEGINVHHNQFIFNDYTGQLIDNVVMNYDSAYIYGVTTGKKASIVPSRFCDNYIECVWSEEMSLSGAFIRVEGNYEIENNTFVNIQGHSTQSAIMAFCKIFKGNKFIRDTETYPWLVGEVTARPWTSLETEIDIESIADGVSSYFYGFKSQLKANGCIEYNITTNTVNNPLWIKLGGIRSEIDVFAVGGAGVKAKYYRTGQSGWDTVFGIYENPVSSITFTGYYHYSTSNPPYVKLESLSVINIHIVQYANNFVSIDNAIILSSAPSTSGYRNFANANPVNAALPAYNKYVGSHAILSKDLHKMCIKTQNDVFYTHDGFPASLNTWGTTANRPTLTANEEGFEYYDTTLHCLIRWNGTVWTDVTGVPLTSSVKVVAISQTDYDNLSSYDSSTLYVITST